MGRLRLSLALLTIVLLVPSSGAAQGSVTLDQFRPAETAEDGFAVDRPDDRGHLRVGAMLTFDYAYDPLVYLPAGGRPEIEIVRNHLVANLGVHLGLFDRVVLFAGMPFHVLMDGASAMPGLAYAPADGAGLGDTRLGGRVRLFGERDEIFALAVQATFTLPTAQWSNGAQTYSGERSGGFAPMLIGEVRYAGFRFTLDVGARLRFTDEAQLQTVRVGQELTWAAGVTIPIVDRVTSPSHVGLTGQLEAFGATSFEAFGDRVSSPVELLAGLRVEPICGLFIGLAGGAGVTRGYGAPDARGVVSVGYSDSSCTAEAPAVEVEPPAPSDRDHDGVLDTSDGCPDEAEDHDDFEDEDGCPDLDDDDDQVPDASDGAPRDPEDRDGFEDEDGVPDPDDDHDGVHDASDACVREPEDIDGFEDENGCPDPDNDGDGFLDVNDECPLEVGTERAHGCPETARIDAETGTIVIFQRVEFSTNRDRIVERSFGILQEVADLLAMHPEITRVRIEGHTDDRGRDGANLELSRRRARSVVRWLIAHGVEASRLEGWGCGELHPIEANDTREGRQNNRRVEFHVLTPTPPSGPHAPEGCVEAPVP